MRYAKIVESSRIIPDTSARSIDIRLMLSYVVVSVLLLVAIYAFSGPYEPDPAQFASGLVMP